MFRDVPECYIFLVLSTAAKIMSNQDFISRGAVASWLVRSSPDRAVRVRALGPVSRKPRKLFGPVKTERCIRLKLLV